LQVGKIGIGILDERLPGVAVVLGNDDGGGPGQLEVGLVFRVGEEGELALAGFTNAGHAGDLDGTIADDRSVDRPRDRLERDLHPGLPLNRFALPAPGIDYRVPPEAPAGAALEGDSPLESSFFSCSRTRSVRSRL